MFIVDLKFRKTLALFYFTRWHFS